MTWGLWHIRNHKECALRSILYIVRNPINIFLIMTLLSLAIILLAWSLSTYWFSPKIDPLDSLDNSFHYFSEIDQFHPWLVWQSPRKLNCFSTSKWVPTPFPTWKKILLCSTNKPHTCPFLQYKNYLRNLLNWKIYWGKKLHASQERH